MPLAKRALCAFKSRGSMSVCKNHLFGRPSFANYCRYFFSMVHTLRMLRSLDGISFPWMFHVSSHHKGCVFATYETEGHYCANEKDQEGVRLPSCAVNVTPSRYCGIYISSALVLCNACLVNHLPQYRNTFVFLGSHVMSYGYVRDSSGRPRLESAEVFPVHFNGERSTC
jgi:hypothetical protein